MSKNFNITITEVLKTTVEVVDAENLEEAIQTVKDQYHDQEIILTANDFTGQVTFEEEQNWYRKEWLMPVYQITKTVTTTEEIYAKNEMEAQLLAQDDVTTIEVNGTVKTKKLDNDLLDALEEGDISFQDFLEDANNTHVTKAQKDQFIELLKYNIWDYNNADDCIDVYTSISSHPEKQGQKDITILRINQYPRNRSIVENTFHITLLEKYDVSEEFYE